MKTTLTPDLVSGIMSRLQAANTTFSNNYPGDLPARQPVQTVYGGAQIFKSDTAQKLGASALGVLMEYAPNFVEFAKCLRFKGAETLPTEGAAIEALGASIKVNPSASRTENEAAWLAHTVHSRVVEKLRREAVEDFRIDFEDGYGNRPDAEEDHHAEFTALEVAKGLKDGTLPPFIGIRIKTFSEELKARSIRTLDIFLSTLLSATGGKLPPNFVVTLPKVIAPEQVTALVEVFSIIERQNSLPDGFLKLEIMVETPQSIFDPKGQVALPAFIAAARGRCTGAHFGVYDYTASCNITASHQSLVHPACDFARSVMKVALAGTGVWISDGATNIMPVGPHRAENGGVLTAEQQRENREAVHRAWRLNFEHVNHTLMNAYYQGWDLHPAQFPIRYAAVYLFYLSEFDGAARRLRAFMDKAAQATLLGDVFDDAATGQGLLNFFLRGINCGAITEEEALESGLTLEEIRSRSFVKILNARRGYVS